MVYGCPQGTPSRGFQRRLREVGKNGERVIVAIISRKQLKILWPTLLLVTNGKLQTSSSIDTSFNRTAAMHLTIFTARRVCIARTMPWQLRCLSVCLSVCHTPVLCVNGYTEAYPQSLFISGSPTILVFPDQTGWQYSDGDTPNGGAECKGVWKNHDLRPISGFISELMQENRKPHPSFRMVPVWVTLSDL